LHEGGAFAVDEGFEFLVEGGEVGVVVDGVKGVVVAMIALVFPDMDCGCQYQLRFEVGSGGITKGIAVSDFGSPASYQVHLVLWHACHTRIPGSNRLNVFIYLVWLHLVEDNRVHVFPSRENLTEGVFHLAVHLSSLLGAVDQAAQLAFLGGFFFLCRFCSR